MGSLYNPAMSRDPRHASHDEYLDAKGLNCPLPVLKAKFALTRMQPGQVLYVEATDPHATIDFKAYCARAGHDLLDAEEREGLITFRIRRAADPRRD